MRRYLKELRWFKSLQNKILFVFFLLILPLGLLLVYYNFYASEVIRNQVAHSNANVLSMYLGTLDRELEDIDKYLFNLIAKEPDLLALDRPEDNDAEAYNLARIRIHNKLATDAVYYDRIGMFFVYSQRNGDLISAYNQQMTYPEQHRLKSELTALFAQDLSGYTGRNLWFLHQEGDSPSLYRMIRYGNVLIGALMSMEHLMAPFEAADLGNGGRFVLVNEQDRPVQANPALEEEGIEFHAPDGAYRMEGKRDSYMVVSKDSSKGAFRVAALIPDRQIMENIPYLHRIVTMIVAGTLIVLPIVYFFLRRMVLVPMKRLVTAMRKIKSGDWETRIDPNASSDEFSMINETFNTMATQIKELKIHVYEEQLHNQKTELKHLQLQMNPHFFLNSLNIIYHLAQVRNFELIQEMSLSLVQHFRYMFRSSGSLVPLREEIEHTRNYVRIQELRFPARLTASVTVEDSCIEALVPPLVCQTFVENAIKHAVSMDSPLQITVKAYVEWEDPHWIWLDIRDTGKGFDEEVLSKLSEGVDIGDERGNHIGIWNIQRRVRLMYEEEDAGVYLSNAIDRGAVVQIRLPMKVRETKGAESDVSSAAGG
ncbi:two-component system, sensor histidine kinase YesM [Paenibacillus sp. UNCCL117]|uniref:sensor histidine kinase n=1 Tax=unclassified Paenibacillus TaxID=185978 RepID=UPI00088A733E|nr:MULTISPECIES: histidine kinase [unclassified Paenibacillus]SDD02673.1 two-component system, sensor histidine kinase YesM [Paenibacillus sp. cl123]SFW32448.1 two-component system, sensor histidine kinase YesM [Paenibacillus sp. UNCCL117]